MTNREVARVLENIADILQIKDDNPFKIRAYRNAADSIYHLDEDLHNLYQQRRLRDIPGVGKAVQEKIEELIEKGSCQYYEHLLEEIPKGVLEMLLIPGIGHKTIKTIYEQLGIESIEDLLKAAQEKRIRTLPGMGGKTEYNIKKGIDMLRQSAGQNTLGFVLPVAEALAQYLQTCGDVDKLAIVGSLRRGKPLVSDIDILVASNNEMIVRQIIKHYREINDIIREEPGYISGKLRFDIPFEVVIVPPNEYHFSLLWTTGSKPHLDKAFGQMDKSIFHGYHSEEEIYEHNKLAFIAPQLREDKGEVEQAAQNSLPKLLELEDLQGDLHVHSRWSDGASTIEEMAETARSMGYSYLAITDHSKSLPISGGLNEDRLKAQGQEIESLNKQWNNFRLLKGIEVDILKDGSLDFTSDILSELDIVVASIHSHFNLDKEQQTERIIKAINNQHVNIIGHLTGRLLNRRRGYELDFDRIMEEAARNKVILEINSHPDRLDIDEDLARKAHAYGVKVSINSDAHHCNDLKLAKYGVLNARRGWLEKGDVINSFNIAEFMDYIKE